MGRIKVIDKGPRNIDLDILLFARGDEGVASMIDWNDERLILPHKLMFEREFVLRPLYEYVKELVCSCSDLLTSMRILHSENDRSFDAHIRRKLDDLRSDPPLSPLTPMGHELPLCPS
jgi:2-amino-4-hydroxy-6-hydroxymethyldihydropteridine diphosphokinase/dihydropteroate synthase